MQKRLATFLVGLLAVPTALACTCPPGTDYWWQQSSNVMLVRINAVASRSEQAMTRKPCVPSHPRCVQKQIARFTVVEAFKGSGRGLTNLASGYGSGDCGIPVIAGAFYVVFLERGESEIGICNAAGPYVMRNTDKGTYPKRIEPFANSLRKVAKDPKAVIAPRPLPQPMR